MHASIAFASTAFRSYPRSTTTPRASRGRPALDARPLALLRSKVPRDFARGLREVFWLPKGTPFGRWKIARRALGRSGEARGARQPLRAVF